MEWSSSPYWIVLRLFWFIFTPLFHFGSSAALGNAAILRFWLWFCLRIWLGLLLYCELLPRLHRLIFSPLLYLVPSVVFLDGVTLSLQAIILVLQLIDAQLCLFFSKLLLQRFLFWIEAVFSPRACCLLDRFDQSPGPIAK